mgnify:CR=1 FL=1
MRALAPKLLESPKKAARAVEILTALSRTEPDVVRDAAASVRAVEACDSPSARACAICNSSDAAFS